MGKHIQLPTHGTHGIGAYLAEPEGKPKGGIVVIQEIFGVNQHMRNVTDRFAKAGYMAIAPCFFDHIEPGIELAYTSADMERGKKLATELGLERALEDVANAEEAISAATERTGTVGYCWGGTVALLSAIRLGLPSVSYYGGRNVQFLSETLKAPVEFHFGEKDQGITPDMVAKHRRAVAEHAGVYVCRRGPRLRPRHRPEPLSRSQRDISASTYNGVFRSICGRHMNAGTFVLDARPAGRYALRYSTRSVRRVANERHTLPLVDRGNLAG